jgi:aspartate-semialdehyde dehydrogenase
MSAKGVKVGIVGATGAVGEEIVKVCPWASASPPFHIALVTRALQGDILTL